MTQAVSERSIRSRIFLAVAIASDMALSKAGEGLPSHAAIRRAAKIEAAISTAPLRISIAIRDTAAVYHVRFIFAMPKRSLLKKHRRPELALPQSTKQFRRKMEQIVSQNSNSVSVKVVGADKTSTVVFSSTGQGASAPSAGVPLTVSKTVTGKITKVSGTISGVVVELPEH